MTQPAGNNYQAITSRAGIYTALNNSYGAEAGYGISQADSVQDLSSLQGQISSKEQAEAKHFMGLAKDEAKAMQIAVGIGATMAILGGLATNLAMFGGVPDDKFAITESVGNIMTEGSQVATQTTQGLSQAAQMKARGKLTQTQEAGSLSQQIAQRAQKQQQSTMKAASEEMSSLGQFIEGQTNASSTGLFRG